MEIIFKGEPKEMADFVKELQSQPSESTDLIITPVMVPEKN